VRRSKKRVLQERGGVGVARSKWLKFRGWNLVDRERKGKTFKRRHAGIALVTAAVEK